MHFSEYFVLSFENLRKKYFVFYRQAYCQLTVQLILRIHLTGWADITFVAYRVKVFFMD